jgi:hypothetical protein
MRDFKFFQDNDEEEDFDGASWMWRSIPVQARYEIVIEEHYGIRSFLSQFSPYVIINVHTIVGPDGIIHDRNNDGCGWGFDITRDLIKITWIRFI